MGYSTPEKNDMFKEGAKEKEKLQEKRRARSKRWRKREVEVGKEVKEWDSEPVLGLVINPWGVIGKLFHSQNGVWKAWSSKSAYAASHKGLAGEP